MQLANTQLSSPSPHHSSLTNHACLPACAHTCVRVCLYPYSYQEFARVINTDDILAIKVKGAEEAGLVTKAPPKPWKNGLTMEEVDRSQKKLREWFCEVNSRFRKTFRALDEDKGGWVDREELKILTRITGTEAFCSDAVLHELIEMMDVDGDGRILYKEFVAVIMADNVFDFDKSGASDNM